MSLYRRTHQFDFKISRVGDASRSVDNLYFERANFIFIAIKYNKKTESVKLKMENKFGKPLMERESDMKSVVLKRAIFMALGIGCFVGAAYMGLFMETEAAWASILLAVIIGVLGLVFFIGSFAIKKQRTILYEEGVFVANGKDKYHLHFNDIIGISDEAGDGVVVRGGLVQVLVASAVVATAGKIADAHNRKHRIRAISIWAEIEGKLKSHDVIKSTGDVLSQVYTEWLIAQKNITAENLNSLILPFAENLELNHGMFTFTDEFGKEIKLKLADITDITYEEDRIQLCALNEKGKVKPIIKLPIRLFYNLDLMYYIYNLQNSRQE